MSEPTNGELNIMMDSLKEIMLRIEGTNNTDHKEIKEKQDHTNGDVVDLKLIVKSLSDWKTIADKKLKSISPIIRWQSLIIGGFIVLMSLLAIFRDSIATIVTFEQKREQMQQEISDAVVRELEYNYSITLKNTQ